MDAPGDDEHRAVRRGREPRHGEYETEPRVGRVGKQAETIQVSVDVARPQLRTVGRVEAHELPLDNVIDEQPTGVVAQNERRLLAVRQWEQDRSPIVGRRADPPAP